MSDFDKISLITALKEKVFHNDSPCSKELEELLGFFIKREYPRKKILVIAGEKWDKIFFVHQGIIRLFLYRYRRKGF